MAKLNFKVFRPQDDDQTAVFKVVSTIIYGEKEAWLVDAQFQKHFAKEVVKEIKELGRKLTLIYISYSDPDYYFALDVYREAFPDVKIVSTVATAWLIGATKAEKEGVWKAQMKDDAPSETIVPEAVKELPLLEGEKVEIRQRDDDLAHSFLWVPTEKTILGGVNLTEGRHPWLADTHDVAAIDKWITQLEDEIALKPETVIAAHYAKDTHNPKILDDALAYMKAYREAVSTSTKADEIITKMKKLYPDYQDEQFLALGAQVVTGEALWVTRNLYPGVDRHVTVDFMPAVIFDLDFHDDKTMTFIGTDGIWKGYKDTVAYKAIEVEHNVFMVYWQERNGMSVVHVQNWDTKEVWTNIFTPKDGTIEATHLKGSIKE